MCASVVKVMGVECGGIEPHGGTSQRLRRSPERTPPTGFLNGPLSSEDAGPFTFCVPY
jgi:hypothetical protein